MDTIASLADNLSLNERVTAKEIQPNKRKLLDTNENTRYSVDSLTEAEIKKILQWVDTL